MSNRRRRYNHHHNQQRAKKEDSGSSFGFASGLLVAGGAAALGYLAHKLWSESPQQQTPYENHPDEGKAKSDMGNNNSKTDVPDSVSCIVCMEKRREIILEPCKHVCLCQNCGEKFKQCPVCSKDIIKQKKVYLP